jgi:homoserine kinase
LSAAVYNVSHAALLALALAKGDLGQFGAMLSDKLHQPYRFQLVKGAPEVVAAANAAGALGCVLSGSGPTMIAFVEGGRIEQQSVGQAMADAFMAQDVNARIIKMNLDNRGTRIKLT